MRPTKDKSINIIAWLLALPLAVSIFLIAYCMVLVDKINFLRRKF